MNVGEVYIKMNELAPFALAEPWDNCGLLVGDASAKVSKILVALDATREAVEHAAAIGAELIVSHHPVIFHAEKRFTGRNPAYMAAARGIAVISAHTSYDRSPVGINAALAEALGLLDAEPMQGEIVGRDGAAEPVIGFVGGLEAPMTPMELAWYAKAKLDTVVRYTEGGGRISRVAVCGGSGADFMSAALANGAGALITGDVRQNEFIDAQALGFTLIDAGHYATENIAMPHLAAQLRGLLPDTEVEVYTGNKIEFI